MELTDQNILIICNEPWGKVWYSKHHYAHELSKRNKVFFLEAPIRWSLKSLFNKDVKIKKVKSNLFVVNYANTIPQKGLLRIFKKLNDKLTARKIKRMLHHLDAESLVFWSFDPLRFPDPKLFNPKTSIFHSVDHYKNDLQYELARNADHVFVVSEIFTKKYQSFNDRVFYIPHGISPPKHTQDDIFQNKEKKEILLIGTITYRVDFEILSDIAGSFPNYNLFIIGKIDNYNLSKTDKEQIAALKSKPNVYFLGIKTFEEIQEYIYRSKLCIASYKQTIDCANLNSLKIYQYLSYGKPVVSTYMEAIKKDKLENLVYMANNRKDFVEKINELIHKPEPGYLRESRIAYTSNITYDKLISRISDLIGTSESKKENYASVACSTDHGQ